MEDKVLRKMFLGLMDIHLLFYAKKEPFYGAWLIEKLKGHGYELSPGTLYPLLHQMEATDLLCKEEKVHEGRIRKYYKITEKGSQLLKLAKEKANELFKELND